MNIEAEPALPPIAALIDNHLAQDHFLLVTAPELLEQGNRRPWLSQTRASKMRTIQSTSIMAVVARASAGDMNGQKAGRPRNHSG